MTPDQPILDFVARHQYLLLASSVVGLGAGGEEGRIVRPEAGDSGTPQLP